MYTTIVNAKKWSVKDIELLRRVYPTASSEELQEMFPSRSLTAIRRKASKVSVRKDKSQNWSAEEIDILLKTYPFMPASQVMKRLPGRSRRAIYSKAQALCCKAYDNSEIDTIIRNQYLKKSLLQISRRIGCSESVVRYRVRLLGLI